MAKQSLGVTLNVPNGQEATGVYEDASGVDVFVTDDPYLTDDGRGLQSPLPVKVVEGATFADSMGNAQTALAVSGLPEPEED